MYRTQIGKPGSCFLANVAAGALSGVVAGQYGNLTYLALSGQIDQSRGSLFRWQDVVRDAALGGIISGVMYSVSTALSYSKSAGKIVDPFAELPIRTNPSEKTSGILISGGQKILLESGLEGPAAQMPRGTRGFDIVTRTHVEGHAAALMHQNEWVSGTLFINNQPCSSCVNLLPRMLPPSSALRIIGPNGYVMIFKGISR